MYHTFLICSSVDGYLSCFHVMAIINSAAMNIGVHVFFELYFSQDIKKERISKNCGTTIKSITYM